MSIFKKFFGSVKTGSGYSKGGAVPLDRDKSFQAGLRKMRIHNYGGTEGKNLSAYDNKKISSVIEPHLKNLPLGAKMSISTKTNIRGKLWNMVKDGEISQEDFNDAKNMLGQF